MSSMNKFLLHFSRHWAAPPGMHAVATWTKAIQTNRYTDGHSSAQSAAAIVAAPWQRIKKINKTQYMPVGFVICSSIDMCYSAIFVQI